MSTTLHPLFFYYEIKNIKVYDIQPSVTVCFRNGNMPHYLNYSLASMIIIHPRPFIQNIKAEIETDIKLFFYSLLAIIVIQKKTNQY